MCFLGQERFRSIARCYYRDAVGTLLVYDIANRASFSAVEQWLGDARQLATPGVVVILVGNKRDLQAGLVLPLLLSASLQKAFSFFYSVYQYFFAIISIGTVEKASR